MDQCELMERRHLHMIWPDKMARGVGWSNETTRALIALWGENKVQEQPRNLLRSHHHLILNSSLLSSNLCRSCLLLTLFLLNVTYLHNINKLKHKRTVYAAILNSHVTMTLHNRLYYYCHRCQWRRFQTMQCEITRCAFKTNCRMRFVNRALKWFRCEKAFDLNL